jgi:hypothetical protein
VPWQLGLLVRRFPTAGISYRAIALIDPEFNATERARSRSSSPRTVSFLDHAQPPVEFVHLERLTMAK